MSEKSNSAAVWYKYFDQTYQREYFYNVQTEESLWEKPLNVEIVDMTGQTQQEEQQQQVEEEVNEVEQYKK